HRSRRSPNRIDPLRFELLDYRAIPTRLLYRLVELCNNRIGCSGGRNETKPDAVIDTFHINTAFQKRWNIRQRLETRSARNAEDFQFPILGECRRGARSSKYARYVAPDHVVDGQCCPSIGDQEDVGASRLYKGKRTEIGRRPNTRMCDLQFAGMGVSIFDE